MSNLGVYFMNNSVGQKDNLNKILSNDIDLLCKCFTITKNRVF